MKDKYTRDWIIKNSIPIVRRYSGTLTLRGLHYKLVNLGMINDIRHYKKVVSAMIKTRWDKSLNFSDFVDHDRETIGYTSSDLTIFDDKVIQAKEQINLWKNSYRKNRWENQPIYPEIFIEKKALIGSFNTVCRKHEIALNPCKGYPSLTFLYDASIRFKEAFENGKEPVIIYFGDYDPSGEDIPRSIQENIRLMGVGVRVERIALMKHQVIAWKLPPAPTKKGDSRTTNWNGLGQVELDAITPEKLSELCDEAILKEFNPVLHDELMAEERMETLKFKKELSTYTTK